MRAWFQNCNGKFIKHRGSYDVMTSSSKNIPYGKTTYQSQYQSNFLIFVSCFLCYLLSVSWFLCLSEHMSYIWFLCLSDSCLMAYFGVSLTSSFFARLNFSSETRILLLYPTVPVLIFKFISLVTYKYSVPRCSWPY